MKKIITTLLAGIMVISLAACQSGNSKSSTAASQTSGQTEDVSDNTSAEAPEALAVGYDWPDFITFLGASSGGNAQLSMSAIAQIVSEYTDSTCTAQVTAGSAQNPYLMEAGDGDYGFNVSYYVTIQNPLFENGLRTS